MTETLSAEDVKSQKEYLNSIAELENTFLEKSLIEDNQKALNTIEARDAEIEAIKERADVLEGLANRALDDSSEYLTEMQALKGQVSLLTKLGKPLELFAEIELEAVEAFADALCDTQTKAEAFIAKVRADERDKAIRECILELESLDDAGKNHVIVFCVVKLKALLTKEQVR